MTQGILCSDAVPTFVPDRQLELKAITHSYETTHNQIGLYFPSRPEADFSRIWIWEGHDFSRIWIWEGHDFSRIWIWEGHGNIIQDKADFPGFELGLNPLAEFDRVFPVKN